MTSAHQGEATFPRRCLRDDDSAGRHAPDERIAGIERDERCLRRAVVLMAVFTSLAAARLGYAAVLTQDASQEATHLGFRIVSVLGLASMICLVVFAGLRLVCRLKLNRWRKEGRQLDARITESRLGRPATLPW